MAVFRVLDVQQYRRAEHRLRLYALAAPQENGAECRVVARVAAVVEDRFAELVLGPLIQPELERFATVVVRLARVTSHLRNAHPLSRHWRTEGVRHRVPAHDRRGADHGDIAGARCPGWW